MPSYDNKIITSEALKSVSKEMLKKINEIEQPTNLVPTSRKINNYSLSNDINLTYSDVGAAPTTHTHSATNDLTGVLPVERGGTNSMTSGGALTNLGAAHRIHDHNLSDLSGILPIAKGGTGASDIAGARSNLGVPTLNHASTSTLYGVGSASNYGHVKLSSANPLVAGVASIGTDNGIYASGDHIHPAQTTITGNAGSATILQTARTVQVNLASTAAASFNGSANITPGITGVLPVGNGGTGGSTVQGAIQNLFPTSKTTTAFVCAFESGYATPGYITPQSLRNTMGLGNTTGVLPVANGGTGLASLSTFLMTNVTNAATVRQLFTYNNGAATTATGSIAALEIGSASTNALMTFHRSGFACHFGLTAGIDSIVIGGWSMGAVAYPVMHEGRQNTAQTNANYTTRQIRNVIESTAAPSGGANGDVWIRYV